MESNINLESLREISDSQLEALLRYDSPPETPIQPTNTKILSDCSTQENLNKSQCDDVTSVPSNGHHNRGLHLSYADSQIDFSVFHNSENVEWSLSPYNTRGKVNSLVDTVDPLYQRDNENCFLELDKNKNPLDASDCNLIEKNRNEINDYNNHNNNFEEIDNILRKIDSISNMDISNMYKCDGSNFNQRQCLTQIELKPHLKSICEEETFSCPVETATHPKLLYLNRSRCFADNKFDINQKEYDNKSCKSTRLCISSDKNCNGNMAGAYEESDCEQSTIQTQGNYNNLSDEAITRNNIQIYSHSKTSAYANIQMDVSSIPLSVKQLYDIVKTNYSDFAFIYALSSQLCQDRVPMECFVTLKIALLLSLASIGNNEYRAPIPIVAMTNDTYMTDYLMTNIGQMGSRFLGTVDEMKPFSKNNWIEADSIVLARGGVYYAGDWSRLKLRRSDTIFKNIECSTVTIEKSTLSFPLETAIWTHWRCFKYGAKDQQIFNKFLKIFGIPIFVADDNHEALIDYTLEQSSIRIFESTVDHLSVNADDMRNFLIYISQHTVDISPEAEILLKNYFVTTRTMRQDCLSKQSYIMLKQFAESFAKLSIRKVVTFDDALAAIILCEHFLENTFSSNSNSPPHLGNFTFVGAVDKYLIKFREWLDSYIEIFKSD